MISRRCGDCQLCCKLLPVSAIGKTAGVRCEHQRHGKGCAVYHKGLPASCRLWSCAWLADADGAVLRRPDRCHYVVDTMLDFVRVVPHDGTPEQHIPCVQVWCDPKFPDAWKDQALFDYLDIRAAQGFIALIRYNSGDGFTLLPPRVTGADKWTVFNGQMEPREHGVEELVNAMNNAGISVRMEFTT